MDARNGAYWLEQRAALARMCEEGESLKSIATHYQVSMSFMGSVLDGLGLTTAGERIKREIREHSRPSQEAGQ